MTINETQPGYSEDIAPPQPIYGYTYEMRPKMDKIITDRSVAVIDCGPGGTDSAPVVDRRGDQVPYGV